MKQHVAHEGKNVRKCRDNTDEAKANCKKSLDEAKRKREEKTIRELELREEVNISRVGGGEEEEVTCVGSSEPHKLGPMDKWVRAIDPKATKSESLKQQKLNKELWKERTHEVHKYIARWVYTHGNFQVYYSVITFQNSLDAIMPVLNTDASFFVTLAAIPFNACDNDEFKQMCEAIG